MAYDSSIRRKIKQSAIEERKKLNIEEVLLSNETRSYLEHLSSSISCESSSPTTINVFKGEKFDSAASTTGSFLSINCNSHIIKYYPKDEQQFLTFMGLFFHEKAHDRFLDFNQERYAEEMIRNGQFYGEPPAKFKRGEKQAWDEMQSVMANPNARTIFQNTFHQISNIISDVHDENCLIDVYGSFVGEGIYLCRNSLHCSTLPYERLIEEVNKGKMTELAVAFDLLLQMARFNSIYCLDETSMKGSKFETMLEKVKDHAKIACVTDDTLRKFTEINYIMIAFWPFIKAEINNNTNNPQNSGDPSQNGKADNNNQQASDPSSSAGQGSPTDNSQSSSGDGSEQQQSQGNVQQDSGSTQSNTQNNSNLGDSLSQELIDKILNELSKGGAKAGETQAPEGKQSSGDALKNRAKPKKAEDKEQSNQPTNKPMDNSLAKAMNNLYQTVAENKAIGKIEEKNKRNLTLGVLAVNANSSHANVPLKYKRILNVSENDIITYNTIMRDLLPISKRLQKQISEALRDLKDGYVSRHRLNGKILNVNDTYRPDGRFFANKKLPEDLPDMAISVLIDHSGSMSGLRIDMAQRAAMLLQDFASGLDIPISISGHRAISDSVEYIQYTDFDDISGKDKYRLAKMTTGGCNRDGMALNIAAGLLEKRQEQIKLLIIISDGRPNHNAYGGSMAAEDIRRIIQNCKRKNIEVLAAAIGDDQKNIQTIYKDEFLNISDLSKLPKLMTDIVKKRIIRNAF